MTQEETVKQATERIRLKDTTCPVILINQARRHKDKQVGLVVSVMAHVFIFLALGASFLRPAQYGIDKGSGSIEVNLVAAPAEAIAVQEPVPQPVPVKPEAIEPQRPQASVKQEQEASTGLGKDKVTALSTGGAISEAKPDYLKNPAPVYPESARRRGYEGTVLLMAKISKEGVVLSVMVEKSSGHESLDQAALKAVWKWRFSPAKFGNLPVESSVRVPVKFSLLDQNSS